MTKISFILGDWSRNIGNAFFQLGGYHVLKKVFPEAQFALISEQPGYPSYWNSKGGNPKNYFDVASSIKSDLLVLMGPIFRPETQKIWGESLDKITAQGTRLILLGIGAMEYDQENIKNYRAFLKKYQPYIFTSRDKDSFDMLGDLAVHAYNGIDFGFFMPEVYTPVGFNDNLNDLIALNFDQLPEPVLTISPLPGEISRIARINDLDKVFEFDGNQWRVEFPGFRTWLAQYSRYTMYLEGSLFGGRRPGKLGKYTFIRLEHRPHPMVARRTFRFPNVVVNDTPFIYAEIYNHAALTLSSRVHACVLALAYGKPAMLFSRTPRVKLLEHLGLSQITLQPVKLDQNFLQEEKNKLVEFLTTHLADL